ncbi:MAG: patatin-like phospholipase family protein [Cyanobacteriota bacterium]|nr:patatin-like phospholipase family protein [Cyanobacteriota bacterium]
MARPGLFSTLKTRWQTYADLLQEVSSYLLYLRVPVLFLAAVGLLFTTQQVKDVLLSMALEPEWGAFLKAAFFGGVFGILLWLTARRLSNLRWMRSTEVNGIDEPDVSSMPPAVVWWLPRWLGIGPLLLFAAGFVFGVGWIGSAPWMVLVLVVEAAALMALLYLRSRTIRPAGCPTRATGLRRAVQALRVRSGDADGLFTPRAELLLMGLAWFNLALITVPISRAAYGPFGGQIGHLYGLLLAGAVLLALWRLGRGEGKKAQTPLGYWLLYGILLVVGLLLPILLNASVKSGVLVPRSLGAIAILFDSLAIILIFVSTLFAFSVNSGVPLVALLLVVALVLNSFRINDNHAVRLYNESSSGGDGLSSDQQPLPDIHTVLNQWLDQGERRQQIAATPPGRPWPIYVVSAQGGGVFAAYHAAKALATLSREVPEFPRHVFAISGVSGGSVGAALYVNALNPSGDNRDIVRRVDRVFDADHLSPVLAALLTGDTTQRLYPWPVSAWDRSLGLELSFSDTPGLREASGNNLPPISLDTPFYRSQLAPEAGANPRPFLVLNTTEVDSGRRFLLAPFTFTSDATFHEPLRADGHQEVRTSTAAIMSARFPFITPYAFFGKTNDQSKGSLAQRERRTVDGGYYDNTGAVTGQELVAAIKASLKDTLQTKVKVVPIAIVNRSNFQRGTLTDRDGPDNTSPARRPRPMRGFSALNALFATREAHVAKTLANFDIKCGTTSSDPSSQSLCITLWPDYKILRGDTSRMPPRPFSIPLGWTLSCQSRAFISGQLIPSSGQRNDPACLHGRLPNVVAAGLPDGPPTFPSFATIVSGVKEAIEGRSQPIQ